MHPVVEIRQPNQRPLFVSVRGPIEVGRECDGVLLADPQVSRRHLLLDVDHGRVMVTDLGSTNGSTIDGSPLQTETVLSAGRVVRCGETTIELDAPIDMTMRSGPSSAQSDGKGTVVPSGAVVDPMSTIAGTSPPLSTNQGVSADSGGATGGAAPGSGFAVQRPVAGGGDMRRTSIDIVAAQAHDDGVDVRSLPADQGTITIVFSDIESSTERNVALGDQVWFDVLGVHNRIVAERVKEHGGTIIKNQGDGFMLSFPGARRALDCMMAVQRDLTTHASAHPDRAVRIRVGMHTGEVLADSEGDLFGQHVVVAARIANLALGGEILVSSLSKEIVASRGDIVFGEPRQVHLKGLGDATVYPMDWARH